MQPTAEELSIILEFASNTQKSYQNSYNKSTPFFAIVSIAMLGLSGYIIIATDVLSILSIDITIFASLFNSFSNDSLNFIANLFVFLAIVNLLFHIVLIIILALMPLIIISIFFMIREGWLSKIAILKKAIATKKIEIQHNIKLYSIGKKFLKTATKELTKVPLLIQNDHVRAVFPFNCSIATTSYNNKLYIISILEYSTYTDAK
jgi:hypothetical protein